MPWSEFTIVPSHDQTEPNNPSFPHFLSPVPLCLLSVGILAARRRSAPLFRALSLSLSRSLFLIFRRRTAACGETGNSREKWREHDPSYTVPEPSSNPPGPLSPRPLSPGHLSNPESLSEPSQPCIFLLYLQLVCKLFAVARPRRVARRKTSEDETGNDSKLASRVFPLGRAARWPWSVFVLERLRELVRELAARRRFPHS